jgi:cell division septum initiation protein DivIVA
MSFGESSAAEVHQLRSENAALRTELAALRSAAGSSGKEMAALLEEATTTTKKSSSGGHGNNGNNKNRINNNAQTWSSPGAGDALSGSDLERYARHISLPAFGAAKQASLARARVLLVGVGGAVQVESSLPNSLNAPGFNP